MAETLKLVILGEDKFSGVMGKLKNHLPSLKTLAIGAGAAIAGTGAAMFAMAKSTAEAYDKVQKFSDRIGISTEALSAYQHVANLSGVSNEAMNMAFQRMTRRVSEAAVGTGVAGKALDELGISIDQIEGRAPDKQFEIIAKALEGVEFQGDKARLAMQFFDSEGVAMLQTLKGGTAGLEAMKAEAEKFGLVISGKAAANAAGFNDSLTRVTGSMRGLRNYISEQTIPTITGLANKFADFVANNRGQIISWGENFLSIAGQIAEYGAYTVGVLIDSWRGLTMLWQLAKIALLEIETQVLSFADTAQKAFKKVGQAIVTTSDYLEYLSNPVKAVSEDLINAFTKPQEDLSKFRGKIDITSRAIGSLNYIVKEQLAESWKKFDEIVGAGSATGKVKEAVLAIKEAFTEIEAAGQASVEDGAQGISPFTNENVAMTMENIASLNEILDETFEAERERQAEQLEEIGLLHDEHYLSEREKLEQWHNQKITAYQGNHEALAKLENVYVARSIALNKNENKETLKRERETQKARQGALNDFYNNIQYLGKNNGRTMFKVAKSLAIARTIQSTYTGAQEAFTALAGIPFIGPALGIAAAAAAIAAGLSRVQQIRSQEYSAAHGGIGYVPKEQTYLLDHGERVLSPRQNEDLVNFMNRGTSASIENLNLNIEIPAQDLRDMTTSDIKDLVIDKFIPAMTDLKEQGIYA